MHLLRSLLAPGIVALAFVSSPAVADVDAAGTSIAPEGRARFDGTFKYEGDAGEAAAKRAAIDRAVDSLFFVIRPIARYRLGETTRIASWISFGVGVGRIRARGPEGIDVSSPDNGSAVPYTFRGERCRVTQRLIGDKLVQTFTADEGVGLNEWTISPDGSVLKVKVTISSSHLKLPIVYSLTYRRSS